MDPISHDTFTNSNRLVLLKPTGKPSYNLLCCCCLLRVTVLGRQASCCCFLRNVPLLACR